MTTQTSFVLLLASIAGIAAIAPTAAGPRPRECRQTDAIPPVTITVAMGDQSISFDADDGAAGVANGDGTFNFDGGGAVFEGWTLDYDLVVDPDPYVFNTITLVNTSASSQQFTITVMLPASSPGLTSMSAYVRGKVADGPAGDGAICSFTGSGEGAVCLIDGAIMVPMTMLAGTSVSAAPHSSATIGPLQKLSVPGPQVFNSIAMRLTFTLTAGDRIKLKGSFIM